ncbi:MAG: alpha-glucan family phosphorylase [Actinomycetaceae bacterium]|nr:alpha-glucan family phosphorylase [Actinomycetaceae bacterium]
MRAIRRFTVRSVLPDSLLCLDRLAMNLRWCWHQPTQQFFESLDPEIWKETHGDPITLIGSLSPKRLEELGNDEGVVRRARELDEQLSAYLSEPRWYHNDFDNPNKPATIAYFSAEFGITAVLPQYSGGLGILAGDHLKSASDLGVPIVGVGLLYQAGYFKQSLTRDGWQRESYPLIDPDNLPLSLLRMADGKPARISLPLPKGRTLHAQVWVATVGRVPLLLLDSEVPENDEVSMRVTDRLYGGSSDHRLEQELLLGVGGVKALRLYSQITGASTPEVYHCNEGHAGFLSIERIRELMEGEGLDFASAIEAVRSATLFTTHTPVPAGIDRFNKDLVSHYLSAMPLPGVSTEQLLALGAESYPGGDASVFNMAVLGLRMGRRANGVAKLHGKVSRGMFNQLWPGLDRSEVPITSITNGVHGWTWVDGKFQDLISRHMNGAEYLSGHGWKKPVHEGGVSDEELWAVRRELRAQLVEAARNRVRNSWLDRGATPAELGWVDDFLDPDVLTIGFARRVPTYKRLTLMMNNPERLRKLLTDPKRPIQILVAGKSHPDDEQGVSLIQRLVQFADEHGVRNRIAFLPNYDMAMAHALMPGCDVWLNNPLRPLEASGTSGMKCALNGALNLSILDGWWDEMYDGNNGWAIPTADGIDDPERRDTLEAEALYDLIENTVAPRFYDRDEAGVPRRWVEMMRHTLAATGPKVQATRMVRDYVEQLYTPICEAARVLDSSGHVQARELATWKKQVHDQWSRVAVRNVTSQVGDQVKVGDTIRVTADVSLGNLRPEDVQVQLLFGNVDQEDMINDYAIISMDCEEQKGDHWRYSHEGALKSSGSKGYTVRVVPVNPLLDSYKEMGLVASAERSARASQAHTQFGS